MLAFTALDQKYLFDQIWSKQSKFLALTEIWYLGYIECAIFYGDAHLYYFRLEIPFLRQVLSENPKLPI